jgi:uncharacterized protein YkwD
MKQIVRLLASMYVLFGCCGGALAEPSPSMAPSPAERKQLQAVATEFHDSLDAAKRLELIRQADEIHPQGAETLRAAIIKQLQPKLHKYRQQFVRVATGLVGEKLQPEAIQEITILRTQVQALRQHEALTKEMIRETGDPALARLKELLLIRRTQVLERLPELQKQREQLAELGAQWELCEQLLAAHEKANAAQPASSPLRFEDYLAKEEEIAAALAVPMDVATRQVLAANERLATRIDPEEARCILDLNLTRHLLGLSPLAIDLALVAAARDHSTDMQNHKFFSHTSPVPGKESFGSRAKLYNTTASAENIAAGTTDGAAANRMWWHSPGHMQNMLGDHRRIGVGRAGTLWTEMLGR